MPPEPATAPTAREVLAATQVVLDAVGRARPRPTTSALQAAARTLQGWAQGQCGATWQGRAPAGDPDPTPSAAGLAGSAATFQEAGAGARPAAGGIRQAGQAPGPASALTDAQARRIAAGGMVHHG